MSDELLIAQLSQLGRGLTPEESVKFGRIDERDELRRRAEEAEQLSALLRDRCQLLGRALAAVWSLVGEEDRRPIMAVLDAPTGAMINAGGA